MTRVVRVIWGRRETIYFCGEDWTGSIALIGLGKLGGWRTVMARGIRAGSHSLVKEWEEIAMDVRILSSALPRNVLCTLAVADFPSRAGKLLRRLLS
jgi:hypothetical protein